MKEKVLPHKCIICNCELYIKNNILKRNYTYHNDEYYCHKCFIKNKVVQEMTFKIREAYNQGEYTEIEVWMCTNCGREYHHSSGADCPCCCPCEFENE